MYKLFARIFHLHLPLTIFTFYSMVYNLVMPCYASTGKQTFSLLHVDLVI